MAEFEQMWNTAVQEGQQRRADRPLSFYGRMTLEGRQVVLQRGLPGGKRDFDPETDPEDAKRMCVRLKVEPVSERATRDFEREFLVSSAEGDLFRDSVSALGANIKDLAGGAYVRVDVVEDPRLGTFPDRTTGATRTRQAGVLREIFPDEATCKLASDARYGAENTGAGSAWSSIAGMPTSPNPPTTPSPSGGAAAPGAAGGMAGVTGGAGLNRETAAKFFPGIWQRQQGDVEKFLTELAANKIMTRHFEPFLEAPEVLAFLAKMGHPEYLQAAGGGEPGGDDDKSIDLEDTPF